MSIISHLRNKAMPFALATAVATASLLSGCATLYTKTEFSKNILHDEAVVVSKKYMPREIGKVLSTVPNKKFSGWRWEEVNGRFTIVPKWDFDGWRWEEVEREISPEEYLITFVGEKTNFKLDDEELYNRFNKDDVVIVNYREAYECTYDDIDGDGKEDLVKKEFEYNQFLGARPKTKK